MFALILLHHIVIFLLSQILISVQPVTGDATQNAGKTVLNIKGKGPEPVLGLGDYAYEPTATCWFDKISDIKSKTRIAIGNHEDDDDEGFSTYMSKFGLSKTYYSFNYNNVHILVIDTDRVSYSSGSSQYNFVKNDLQVASQNSNIQWIIIYLHKPFYTSANTCNSSSCSNTGSTAKALRDTYHSMFDKYGVDVVLQGHVHNYQRTYPVKYDGTSTPTITSSSSTNYNNPTGEIFVTAGTGGVNIHGLSGKASFVKYQQDDKFGALNLIISNNGYKLTRKYYTNDGSKKDEFSISKSSTTTSTTFPTTSTNLTISNYNYGPSLTLSGEDGLSDQDIGIENDDGGKHLGLQKGKGKGLDCAHFTQQGPVRCRSPDGQ